MTRIVSLFLILLTAAATQVEAHAHLVSSQPPDGATLTASPASVTLVFSESAKLTALSLQGVGDKSPKKLMVSVAEDSVKHAIALPTLASGAYILTWHALSDDGHVTSGTVKFSVGSGSPSSPTN